MSAKFFGFGGNFIFKFFKRNKILILFLAAYIILAVLHQFIYPMGDDFYYGTFTKDADTFINMHIRHYSETNGRAVIHLLVSVFLIFDIYLWRFINPAIILTTLYLIYKSAFVNEKNENKNKKYTEALIILILLVFLFDADILKQSVYWLDGSFNYLYPMLMAFLSYYLYKKTLDNNIASKKIYLYYAVFFISGATMEQSGLILFGLFLLETLHCRFIMKIKINKFRIFALLSVLLGYLTVVLAPGTFARFKIHGSVFSSGELLNSVMYIANLTFFNQTIVYMHVILLLSCFFYLHKNKRIFNKILSVCCCVLILFYIISSNIDLTDKTYGVFLYASFIPAYCFILFYSYINMFLENKEKENITDISFIIAAFGAQFMLIISSVFAERTLLPSILCLMIPALRSLIKYKEKHILFLFAATAFLMPVTIYKIIILIPFAVYKIIKINKKNFKLDLALLLIISVFTFTNTAVGYYLNSSTHKYNIAAAKSAAHNNSTEIVLRKCDEKYCMSALHISKYHLYWFKAYYNIPQDTVIVFED